MKFFSKELSERLAAIWKQIKGYEGYYEVSNDGQVKSLKRYGLRRETLILANLTTKKGYKYVSLSRDGVATRFKVHRLVATAFLENKSHFLEINHKDFNKANNAVGNLEWCTYKYNREHARINGKLKGSNGKSPRGENHRDAVFTEKIVRHIRSSNERNADIARKYKVNPSSISHIRTYRTWKHV